MSKILDQLLDKPLAQIEQAVELMKGTRDDAPVLFLPNINLPISDAAPILFRKIGRKERMFNRDGVVVNLRPGGGSERMEAVDAKRLRSILDSYGRLITIQFDDDGSPKIVKAKLTEPDAKALLVSDAVVELPPLRVVSEQPLLVIGTDGKTRILNKGYHHSHAALVKGDVEVPVVPVEEGVRAILGIFRDVQWLTPADQSRAIAGLLTPALQGGKLVPGAHMFPVIVWQADQPQAGKGMQDRIRAKVYGEVPVLVTQQSGGVGSIEERIGAALLSGARLITIDNYRGRLDLASFESMLTNQQGQTQVRVPYGGVERVDASGVSFAITSNGMETTADLAARLLMVNIVKRPPDHAWSTWPSKRRPGAAIKVEEWVSENRAYLLGCVYAVAGAWFEAGQPGDADMGGQHDAHEWALVANWIVRNLFKLPPLLAGHEEAKATTVGSVSPKLRSIALAAQRQGMLDKVLAATDLGDIVAREGLDIFDVDPSHDDPAAQMRQQVGKLMSRAFPSSDATHVAVGDLTIHRFTFQARDEKSRLRPTHRYHITKRVLTLDERAAIEKVARIESQRTQEPEATVTTLRRKKY